MDKEKLKALIDSGKNDKEISAILGVSDRTVRKYKKTYFLQNQQEYTGDMKDFISIKGFPNYRINRAGVIINNRNLIVKILTSRTYPYVDLFVNNKSHKRPIHLLMATHFIENPNNLPIVNHIDGNKLNFEINNLEWTTYSGNNKHAYDSGLKTATHGERVTTSKLSETDVINICKLINNGKSSSNIIEELKLTVNISTINKIRNKTTWTRVSKNILK